MNWGLWFLVPHVRSIQLDLTEQWIEGGFWNGYLTCWGPRRLPVKFIIIDDGDDGTPVNSEGDWYVEVQIAGLPLFDLKDDWYANAGSTA